MFIKANTAELRPILSATFPRNRKDVSVKEFIGPLRCNSYWDGGSKDEYFLCSLADGKRIQFPTSHPYFDRCSDGDRAGILEVRELPEGTCLVQGGTTMGKPATVTVYFRSENLAKLLPPPVALSESARKALGIIRSIRGGYRQDEFSRANLGRYSADNQSIVELKDAGLVKVNKAGAISITTNGRNA
jgi:hypothetical protein